MSALDDLRQIVSTCTSCPLHAERTQTVFDRGNVDADLMVIGEAPGREEDLSGDAFVGRAGQRQTRIITAAQVPEDHIYFGNVLKCRPPRNRFPDDPAIPLTCMGYLRQQIDLVKPIAIVLAGKQALRYVLLHGTSEQADPVGPWINKQFRRRDLYGDIRFLVVYHPSYLLRRNDPQDEAECEQAYSQIWQYVSAKRDGRAPPVHPHRDIRPTPPIRRMGRNLFGRSE